MSSSGPPSPSPPASCPAIGTFSLSEPSLPLVNRHFETLSVSFYFLPSGESAFTTIAPTVLGDLFTDETRSMVYGIFYTAIPIGSGLGFVVGNAPSEWRMGLRITPGLTFLAAVLILVFLYDPPRGESEGKTITNRSSYMEDLKYIGGNILIVKKTRMIYETIIFQE